MNTKIYKRSPPFSQFILFFMFFKSKSSSHFDVFRQEKIGLDQAWMILRHYDIKDLQNLYQDAPTEEFKTLLKHPPSNRNHFEQRTEPSGPGLHSTLIHPVRDDPKLTLELTPDTFEDLQDEDSLLFALRTHVTTLVFTECVNTYCAFCSGSWRKTQEIRSDDDDDDIIAVIDREPYDPSNSSHWPFPNVTHIRITNYVDQSNDVIPWILHPQIKTIQCNNPTFILRVFGNPDHRPTATLILEQPKAEFTQWLEKGTEDLYASSVEFRSISTYNGTLFHRATSLKFVHCLIMDVVLPQREAKFEPPESLDNLILINSSFNKNRWPEGGILTKRATLDFSENISSDFSDVSYNFIDDTLAHIHARVSLTYITHNWTTRDSNRMKKLILEDGGDRVPSHFYLGYIKHPQRSIRCGSFFEQDKRCRMWT